MLWVLIYNQSHLIPVKRSDLGNTITDLLISSEWATAVSSTMYQIIESLPWFTENWSYEIYKTLLVVIYRTIRGYNGSIG